jgi:predicted nucleotide-binding protein (sugar kinase/HSP70/actin superfamily)
MERFLREMGVRVLTTPKTTPGILKTATTICSADFCIPVRVLVGHVYALAQDHPDLDAIIVPNVCREHGKAVHCSKYRDISGIVIRSIAGTVGYLASRAGARDRAELARQIGLETVQASVERGGFLPRVLQPEVWSADREPLFHTCYRLYRDLTCAAGGVARVAAYLPERLRRRLAPQYAACRAAFAKAYDAVIVRDRRDLDTLLRDPSRPRLAVLGRSYLHDDPLITADLKPYFRRRGCDVISPHDLPFRLLENGFSRTDGFYESHKMYQAFLDLVADRVDGIVVIGAFGCHPDAFENQYFLERARERGLPAWVLKYDEQPSSTGFMTRYETILGFLEQRRDDRIARQASLLPSLAGDRRDRSQDAIQAVPAADALPVLVWPHMSPILDITFEELLHQAGLSGLAVRPAPLSTDAIETGNFKFAESCCPYALTTGSLILSVRRVLEAARSDGRPRRIVLLQGRGDGPCTYGWYARMQRAELPRVFAEDLASGGHTMEMLTLGGAGLLDFLGPLSAIGRVERLAPLVELARVAGQPGGLRALPWGRRRRLMRDIWKMVHPRRGILTASAMAKLGALEELRARTLIVRAHERERGATTAVWRQVCAQMRDAHTLPDIARVQTHGLAAVAAVDQDTEVKPRVLVVGEIYVVLASFANRGTVDTLLGREGIEVVEGTTLLDYIESALAGMRRSALVGRIRPIADAATGGALSFEAPPNFDRWASPFVLHSLGGDGRHSVSAARNAVERLEIDGIVHLYPFKCMPETMAKTALSEIAQLYGVKYLPLDFDKELDIQRLRTEVSTFAGMLKIQLEQRGFAGAPNHRRAAREEGRRRRRLGATLDRMLAAARAS